MCLWHRTVASCSFLIFLHYITNFTLQIITVSPNYAETVRIKPQTRPFPLSLRPQLAQPLPRFWRSAVPRQKSPALALLNCHNESPGCHSKRIMPHGRLFPGLVTLVRDVSWLYLLDSSCKFLFQIGSTVAQEIQAAPRLHTITELVELAAWLGCPHPRCRAAAAHRKAVTESPPQARKELCNELQDVLPKTYCPKRVCKVVESRFCWIFKEPVLLPSRYLTKLSNQQWSGKDR